MSHDQPHPVPEFQKCVTCPHKIHSGQCAECLCTHYPELHPDEPQMPKRKRTLAEPSVPTEPSVEAVIAAVKAAHKGAKLGEVHMQDKYGRLTGETRFIIGTQQPSDLSGLMESADAAWRDAYSRLPPSSQQGAPALRHEWETLGAGGDPSEMWACCKGCGIAYSDAIAAARCFPLQPSEAASAQEVQAKSDDPTSSSSEAPSKDGLPDLDFGAHSPNVCDCDLVGGDSDCRIQPPYMSAYSQRCAQLLAALSRAESAENRVAFLEHECEVGSKSLSKYKSRAERAEKALGDIRKHHEIIAGTHNVRSAIVTIVDAALAVPHTNTQKGGE